MVILLILFIVSLKAHAGEHEKLAQRIGKDYAKMESEYEEMYKGKDYQWEFVEVNEIPLWCRDDIDLQCGEIVWVEEFGQIMRRTENGVCVAVRSWFEKKHDRSQVTRLFVYEKDNKGIWQRQRTFKITENWNSDLGWICQR